MIATISHDTTWYIIAFAFVGAIGYVIARASKPTPPKIDFTTNKPFL